jgi:hypothetical protein
VPEGIEMALVNRQSIAVNGPLHAADYTPTEARKPSAAS